MIDGVDNGLGENRLIDGPKLDQEGVDPFERLVVSLKLLEGKFSSDVIAKVSAHSPQRSPVVGAANCHNHDDPTNTAAENRH